MSSLFHEIDDDVINIAFRQATWGHIKNKSN